MKIEIEITDAEIKASIEKKIRETIAYELASWNAEPYIKERVRAHWKEVADQAIQQACNDAPKLKEKIEAALENKLKGQLNAVLKGIK